MLKLGRLFRANAGPTASELQQEQQELNSLPLAEAMGEATLALKDDSLYTVKTSSSDSIPQLSQLPPSVANLFATYEYIEFHYGEMKIGRKFILPSRFSSDFTRIGVDALFAEILVRSDSDSLVISDEAGFLQGDYETFASVYHYICYLARLKEADVG